MPYIGGGSFCLQWRVVWHVKQASGKFDDPRAPVLLAWFKFLTFQWFLLKTTTTLNFSKDYFLRKNALLLLRFKWLLIPDELFGVTVRPRHTH